MHLRVGVAVEPPLDFRDGQAATRLQRRDEPGNKLTLIVAGVIIGLIALSMAFVIFRAVRNRRSDPKYALSDGDDTTTDTSPTRRRTRMREAPTDFEAALTEEHTRRDNPGTNVDRNTSVRSVMTLPAYRQRPSETEHVLGREGERDGIDVVVELPTAETDEAMREEEMESLFQIRLARRRQIAEREERRQRRRDARERNDIVALQDIRERARQAGSNNQDEIDNLRQEHERAKGTRQRAVSSVSYADLGVARHDGTRLRANSTESERVGLLSDAASIDASARSPSSLNHRRDRSASSVLSIDTLHSDQPGSPGRPGSRTNSGANTPRISQTHTRAGSSPELIDAPEGDAGDSPPGYDEVSLNEVTPVHSRAPSPYPDAPPDYPGPTAARNQRLSAHVADMVAEDEAEGERRLRRGVGAPQLPSLRLARLPQIVIEPSSALPRDDR